MGVLDFFKRTGKPITSETLEAKIGEVGASIAEKQSEVVKLRAELPEQVLNGDNLAAHRIEHEQREIEALQIAKAELEAKLVDVRESETVVKLQAECDIAEEKMHKCEEAARAVALAIEAVISPAKILFAAQQQFAALIDDRRARGWHLERNISETFCDLIAAEFYFRSEGAVKPTPRISKMSAYSQRGDIEEFLANLRGCVEAMRDTLQRRRDRGGPWPGSVDAAA